MAFRAGAVAKVQSTTVAQPLIGSWITAGIGAPSRVPLTITLGTATDNNTDALDFFQVGDPVLLINPNGANAETCRIQSIASGAGNTVTLGPQNDNGNNVTRYSHVSGVFGTGTFIALATDNQNFYVQYEDGATGAWLYLGNQYNMTAIFHRFTKLAKVPAGVQPYSYSASENFFGAPFRMSEIWVLGTSVGDLFNVSLGVL